MKDLTAIARSWIGTPFAPHARVKGAGVDCVHLAAEIYIELGWLDRFDPPQYKVSERGDRSGDMIEDWLRESAAFDKVEVPQICDLVCIRLPRDPYHVGVMVTSKTFVHAIRHYGVIESLLAEPTWAKRLGAVYRPRRAS